MSKEQAKRDYLEAVAEYESHINAAAYLFLIGKGFSANMADLLQDLRERDARDTQRAVAPLKPAEGAHLLDTSDMTIDQAVAQVLAWYQTA